MNTKKTLATWAWVALVVCMLSVLLNFPGVVSVSPAASLGKPKRIGFLYSKGSSSAKDIMNSLVKKIERSGLRRGRDFEVITRSSDRSIEATQKAAKKLEGEGIDVLVTMGSLGLVGSFRGTASVPIVFLVAGDILNLEGIAKSFEEPGGRVTGIRAFIPWGKYLEYATTFMPGLKSLGVLVDAKNPGLSRFAGEISSWSRKMNLTDHHSAIESPRKIAEQLKALSSRVDLLILLSIRGYKSIRIFAANSPVPVSSSLAVYKNESFFTYTMDNKKMGRQAGKMVLNIMMGISPSIIPIEIPDNYSLTINRRVAKKIGISLDRGILRLAQRVIE